MKKLLVSLLVTLSFIGFGASVASASSFQDGSIVLASNDKCGGNGSCGAGKCGGDKTKKCSASGKCGGDKKGSCGAGKCGGDKKGSCGAGKCGGDKKGKAPMGGSCGQGKCS